MTNNRDWETIFRSWIKPSSDSEQTKYENAEGMIREAISKSEKLKSRTIKVFAQGSYRNNTNVRLESDVDICVLCSDTAFCDYTFAQEFTKQDVNLGPAEYLYNYFRNDVHAALVAYFGSAGISRGSKAFDVHETSRHVDADVVACFEHRRYTTRNWSDGFNYETGTEFIADDGKMVINWPEQHYANGVAKNTATGSRFKYLVRILKRLRNEMADNKIKAAEQIPSFLIECLMWNVPNPNISGQDYKADMRSALAFLFNNTLSVEKCIDWGEISERKYLFRGSNWTWGQGHNFISAAWDYIGFE